ncbi:MAG: hypothetical protein GTO02_23210 [Candidatus Dadabacteria bacterium]|nr:hypothetical protein [Candidatus Dadabacteria bacterium]NIQ17181.1 hypothetical protein [Candidatus Dadabacteria bacterium]
MKIIVIAIHPIFLNLVAVADITSVRFCRGSKFLSAGIITSAIKNMPPSHTIADKTWIKTTRLFI